MHPNYHPDEFNKQWASAMQRASNGHAGVTIGTLIARARKGGYSAPAQPQLAAPNAKPRRFPLHSGKLTLLAKAPPPRNYVWKGILVPGTFAVLGGPGGVSKTMLAMGLAVRVALGHPWSDLTTRIGCVQLFLGEEEQEEVDRRMGAIAKNFSALERADIEARVRALPLAGQDIRLTRLQQQNATSTGVDDDIVWLSNEHAKECGISTSLIVIDHARLVLGGDPNAADHVTELTRVLTNIAQRTSAVVLLIAHSPKATLSKIDEISSADIAGSSAFVDNSRCTMVMTTMSPEEAKKYGKTDTREQYVRLRIVKTTRALLVITFGFCGKVIPTTKLPSSNPSPCNRQSRCKKGARKSLKTALLS